jgi:hypothetical protein
VVGLVVGLVGRGTLPAFPTARQLWLQRSSPDLSLAQASAAELFDLWDDHCGRPRKPAAPAGPAAAAGARAASAAENGQGEDAQGPLLVGQGSSEALLELEGGAAGEAQGQLLGDAVERRSWKRRAREALIFAGAYLAAGASNAWRTARQGLWQADAALIGGRLFARSKRAVAATDGVADESGGGDAEGRSDSWRESRRRTTPGFLPTFYWCLGRAALKRTREPLSVLTDYAIFALTGAGRSAALLAAAQRELCGRQQGCNGASL